MSGPSLSKPRMKTRPDVEPCGAETADLFDEIPVHVLQLARLAQRLYGRRFDTDEHYGEARVGHGSHELGAVRQVDGRLGEEVERGARARAPRGDFAQEPPHVLLAAYEVVVYEEHAAPETGREDRLELGDHLAGRLRAWDPSIERDDVAELALERTAARELNREVQVEMYLQQVVAGYGREAHVWLRRFSIDAISHAGLEVRREARDDLLALPQHEVVGCF